MIRTLMVSAFCGVLLISGLRPAEAKDAKAKSTAKLAVIEFSGELPEGAGTAGLFADVQPSLSRMIERLDQAAHDEKIAAVLLEIRDVELGRGKIHELRTAISAVRKAGKKVYADIRSAEGPQYLLAAACDEIMMPESGTLAVTGVRAEVTFYKDLLDKLGVKAEVMQMGDYKGTGEPFTRSSMSPEFRRDIELLLDDVYNQLIDTVAADRKLDRGHVKDLVDQGIFTASEAKEAGLIDRVAYRDEFLSDLAKQLKVDEIELVPNYGKKKIDTDFSGFNGFLKLIQLMTGGEESTSNSKHKKIAVVYVVGEIVDGNGGTSLLGGSESVGGDEMLKALAQAEDDPKVEAIVLRIDSPGGSALASDLVWRAVVHSKKPIVTSMGDVAASGGYYIAMGSKKIIAEPGTITGSIGVVGGKVALKGLMDKVGIKTDTISRGRNSGWQSSVEPFTQSERDAWVKTMKDMYRQFTSKAAAGRKLDEKHLRDDLAGGRVYTGRVAVGNKLVDKVGTLDDAVAEAKSLAGLKADEPIDRLILPKPKSIFDCFFGDDMDTEAHVRIELPDELRPLATGLREALLFRRALSQPAATMMPFKLELK